MVYQDEVFPVADGLPGAPKKYDEGVDRINGFIPTQLAKPFDDFCKLHHLYKTDVIVMAINYVIMAPDEREAKLRQALFLSENLQKQITELKEQNGKLNATITQLRAKPEKVQPLQSLEAREFLERTREKLEAGKFSRQGLSFSLEHLRQFSINKNLPESQRAEIISFLEKTGKFSVDDSEEQKEIRRAEAQGLKAREIAQPTTAVYDFTKTEPVPKRTDDEFEALMGAAVEEKEVPKCNLKN